MARLTLLALFIGACALAHAEEAEQIVPLVLEDVPEPQEVEQSDEIEKRGAGSIPYDSLGCYKEDIWRVLKKYHGDFNNAATAIQECARKAKFAGHNIFGVAYGKQCFSDATASVNNAKKTYARLGRGSGCSGGRGGFWRINVYKLRVSNSVSYAKLGCYKDDGWRVIKGHHEIMNSDNVIGQCARKAQLAGNKIFGVEAGKWCFTDGKASESHKQTTYARLGKTTGCTNGKGGPWKMDVYKVLGTDAAYNNLGCFKDDIWRVIKGPMVTFNPATAVQQCANRALAQGNTIFGVQSNDQCFTHSDAANTYKRLGKTTGCENGRGHSWKMNVYSASEGNPPQGSCPISHPFAYLNGDYCCATNKEKVDKKDGERCDGGRISISSSCCEGNWKKCPTGKCASREEEKVEYEEVYEYVWVPADEPAAVEDESVEEPEAEEDEPAEEPAAEEPVADEEAAVEDQEEEIEEPIAEDEEEQA